MQLRDAAKAGSRQTIWQLIATVLATSGIVIGFLSPRFDGLEKRIDQSEKTTNQRFEDFQKAQDKRLDDFQKTLDKRFDDFKQEMRALLQKR